MSNAVSSPEPSVITRETRSGRRWPSALAKWPPREWPISASGRPASPAIRAARASSASRARSEQPTLQAMPERCGRWPIRSSQPAITDNDVSPARKPGISITGPPSPRGTPLPANTGSSINRPSSACQRSSAPWRPHQRRGASGGAGGGGVGSKASGTTAVPTTSGSISYRKCLDRSISGSVLPSFHTVLDLGLRDVGVRNDRRRLAAQFGPRTALLAALAVVFAIVPCWVLRQLGADAWVVGAFALAWAGTVLAVVLRTALRAPVAVVKVTADGPNQASWLLIAPFSLVAVLALVSRDVLLLPLVALHVALAVVLWRGRRRLPDLLARFRSVLAWDETVLGDGLGIAQGLRGRGSARVVVATDRRLLVAGDTERLLELDVPYAGVSRFGMEWKARGRLGVLSLLVDGETHVVTSIAPANLLSIAQALQGHGVATDDPAAVAAAQRGWEEALRRAPRPGRGHARAAMRSRAFDQGLWLLLGLCAVIFYLNPFGIGFGAPRDGVPALM